MTIGNNKNARPQVLRLQVPLNWQVRAVFNHNPIYYNWSIRYVDTEYDLRAICEAGDLPTPTIWQTELSKSADTCKICGGQCVDSKGFETDVWQQKDDPNQMMRTSKAAGLVDCKKCKDCGHSFTPPTRSDLPAPVELPPNYLLASATEEYVNFYDASAEAAYEELLKYRAFALIEDKALFEAYEMYSNMPVRNLLPRLRLSVAGYGLDFFFCGNAPHGCVSESYFRAHELDYWSSPYWELVVMGRLIEEGLFGGVGHEGALLMNFARSVLTRKIPLFPSPLVGVLGNEPPAGIDEKGVSF